MNYLSVILKIMYSSHNEYNEIENTITDNNSTSFN